MRASDRRLAQLRAEIPEVTPAQAIELQGHGAALLDIRDPEEIAQGSPAGALRVGRSYLEMRIEDELPDPQRPVVVVCAGGVRSLFVGESLRQLGYRNVYSLAGGFNRWKDEGRAFETPRVLDGRARERYARHLLMPDIGERGQLKLLDSKVLLIGAGGIGSSAALYLAAAGIGQLGIVDHDIVDRSNLQRQVLHNEHRIGTSKVESARETIEALNPSVKVMGYPTRLDADNVEEIFRGYDLVIDGSDNLPTRYLVSDACVRLGIPNVHGAVYRFEGQVTVFWPAAPGGASPCYRCLFPEPPPAELAPSCAQAGVLGALPGVIGLLQALEALKLLLGLGEPLLGKMLYYDALSASVSRLKLRRDPNCRYCGKDREFPGYVDYTTVCASGAQ